MSESSNIAPSVAIYPFLATVDIVVGLFTIATYTAIEGGSTFQSRRKPCVHINAGTEEIYSLLQQLQNKTKPKSKEPGAIPDSLPIKLLLVRPTFWGQVTRNGFYCLYSQICYNVITIQQLHYAQEQL